MTRTFEAVIQKAQFWCAVLFAVGLAGSITIWQYSLGIAILLTAVRVIREPQQRRVFHELRWFFLFAGLYYGWSLISALAMNSAESRWAGVTEDWTFLAVPVIWSVMQDAAERFARRTIVALAIVILVLTIATLISYPLGFSLLRPHDPNFALNGQASGLHGTSLTFAECLLALGSLIALAALLVNKNSGSIARRLLPIASACALVCVILSGSRIATVVGLVASWLLAVRFWSGLSRFVRVAMLIGPLVLVGLSLAVSSYYSVRMSEHLLRDMGSEYSGSRRFIWGRTLTLIAEHPLFGVGPGEFAREYEKLLPPDTYPQHHFTHAHNDLLNVVATRGIVAAIFYVVLWGYVLRRGLRRLLNGTDQSQSSDESFLSALQSGGIVGLISLLGCGLTEAIFAIIKVRGVIMLLWGIELASPQKALSGQNLAGT